MDARLRRLFGPLPLLLLGLSLAMGWASFPLWRASNQFSEGMRVCYERVNLSLMAHTLKMKKSDFLGASFFQGTEECWGELAALLSSSHVVVASEVALQKSNEIALELHKFNLAMANGESNTKTVLEYWNPLRENIDQLRGLLSTENEIGLQRIKTLAGSLSLAFFVLTFFSWLRSRKSKRASVEIETLSAPPIEVVEIVDSPALAEVKIEPALTRSVIDAPTIDVVDLLQFQTPVEVIEAPKMEVPVATLQTVEEVVETSEESKKAEVQIETVTPFKREVPVLTMGEYIEKLLQDQSDQHFLQGIFVKKQILKDFSIIGNAEAFQNGLFYLMHLHECEESSPGKTIQIILRESAGEICLSIQSGPVKNWEGDNINLILATEALKDAGLNLEWEMSFLGAQSNLVTTCRAPIAVSESTASNASSSNKLTRLVRGKKSQLQKRLRDLSN